MTTKAVPHEVIPCDRLPAGQYRDLPEPPHWRKLVGPSILLLGLSLGSGEFVLWPYITYRFGFVVFWACMVGVLTQYFINMEIERWTLATGETAVTGFCRLWSGWAGVFLLCNVVPWMWPGWASGAATILTWEFGGDESVRVGYSIASLLLVGLALSLGPVVYRTVERIQTVLIAAVLVLLLVIFFLVVEPSHVWDLCKGIVNIGHIPEEMELPLFLGGLGLCWCWRDDEFGAERFRPRQRLCHGCVRGAIDQPADWAGRGRGRDRLPLRADAGEHAALARLVAGGQPRALGHLLRAVGPVADAAIAYRLRHYAAGTWVGTGLGIYRHRGRLYRAGARQLFQTPLQLDGHRHFADDRAGVVGRLRSHFPPTSSRPTGCAHTPSGRATGSTSSCCGHRFSSAY